jgi:fatty acid desaturase
MNAVLGGSPRALFRSRTDAIAHSLALSYVVVGWLASFALMGASNAALDIVGLLLCVHTMVLAAYLIHEAAHQTLFVSPGANGWAGESMSFIAGSSYASFKRIQHMHIRHHVDRADLLCFDLKGFLQRHPGLRRTLQVLEWGYIPAAELLMHLQVVWRPFFERSQRRYRLRVAVVLSVRGALLVALWIGSPRAVLLYALAVLLQLQTLNFFDAFHHTFEQYCVAPDQPIPLDRRDREYEQLNTYSNLLASGHPWLNVLVLNFCYHNAHHHRPSMPWWRLPGLHRELYGARTPAVLSVAELLFTWHRNRVVRVLADDYGAPGQGARRADTFIGTHGVSFLTVV